MHEKLLTIQDVAEILKVSTKTLRRWDKRGILVPQRTAGNQRRYTRDAINGFRKPKYSLQNKPIISEPIAFGFPPALRGLRSGASDVREVSASDSTGFSFAKLNHGKLETKSSHRAVLLGLIWIFSIFAFVFSIKYTLGQNLLSGGDKLFQLAEFLPKLSKIGLELTPKKFIAIVPEETKVLAETTVSPQLHLNINVPSSFNANAEFLKGLHSIEIATLSGGLITENENVNAGTGRLTASNVLYGVVAGTGITIGTGQTPTITNSDLGSSQKIFKTVKVGGDSFSAGSNTDTLELAAGNNITLSTDTSNKKVTITGPSVTASGWTDDGTTVRLTTSTDNIGIGTTSPDTKLHVVGTFKVTGATTLNGIAYTWPSADGSNGYLLSTNGSGSLSWSASSSNFWQQSSGALYPGNSTVDLLIGGTSSASANFRVTGASAFAGTTSSASVSARSSFAALIVDNITGDIFTASSSGVTQFVIRNNGAVGIGGVNVPLAQLDVRGDASVSGNLSLAGGARSIQGTAGNTLTLGGASTGEIFINPSNSLGIVRFNLASSNGLFMNGTAGANVSGACVTTTNGIVTASSSCSGSGSTNWDVVNGTITPKLTSTLDLLLGSQATASAKFAFLNVNSGTPTASISANSGANTAYLTGLGNLATTNMQTLTLGNSTTGNIVIDSGSSSITLSDNTTVVDNNWIGLGGSAGQIEFDDQTIDEVNILNAYLGVGTQTPTSSITWGSSGGTIIDLSSTTSSAGYILHGPSNIEGAFGVASTGQGMYWDVAGSSTASNNFIAYRTEESVSSFSPTERMRITSSGTIGIGTTAPDALLEINHATGDNLRLAYNDSDGSAANYTDFELASDGSLTLTSAGADVTLVSDFNTGVNIGSSSNTAAPLSVSGGIGSNASFIVNNINSGDLITASASGITKFILTNEGNASASAGFTINSAGALQTTNAQTFTLGGASTGEIFINPSNSLGIVRFNLASSNGLFMNGTAGANVSGACVTTTNGIVTASSSCSGSGSTNWDVVNGTIYPKITTQDLLIGGTSSASANFRVTGASAFAGTTSSASVSARSSFAALIVDNITGDIFTASSSGVTQFVIRNNGAVGIGGVSVPLAQLDVRGDASVSGNLSLAGGARSIQGTANNLLTIGGNTTGGITISPNNGAGILNLNPGATGNLQINGANGASVTASCVTTTLGIVTASAACPGGAVSNWTIANGAIRPNQATALDLLIGGDSSSSALFRVTGGNTFAGTTSVASVAARTSFAGLVVDNSGVGDLLTASKAGETKFVVTNNGSVGIGTAMPNEALEVANGNVLIRGPGDSITGPTKITQTEPGQISVGGTTLIASVSAGAVYNGSLYVGTGRGSATPAGGAEVYRYDLSATSSAIWTKVSQTVSGTIASGGTTDIASVSAMIVYNGALYIGTAKTASAEIYRYDGGTTWTRVSSGTAGTIRTGGSGNEPSQDRIASMVVYGGRLFAGTAKLGDAMLYRYDGTGAGSWTAINSGTVGAFQFTVNTPTAETEYDAVSSMVVYNNQLILGLKRGKNSAVLKWSPDSGSDLFLPLTTLARVVTGTICSAAGSTDVRLVVYNGKLYAGTQGDSAQVCRYDESDISSVVSTLWTDVNRSNGTIRNGGTSGIYGVESMVVYNGRLYIGTNKPNGAEVYQYGEGSVDWIVLNGTAGTIATGGTANLDLASVLIPYNGSLYIGVSENNPTVTTAAEIYSYTNTTDISYALKFNAASLWGGAGAGGGGATEVNNNLNVGSISFMASASASVMNGTNGTGAFLFSHGILTGSGAYDVAEDYPTRDNSLTPGDIVAIDGYEKGFVKKSEGIYDRKAVGVFSENPGLRLSQKDSSIDGGQIIPVALAGRVPVKVSLENGEIRKGDYLTSSSAPGVAMKAVKAGAVIGKALEPFNEDGVGKILAFVNVSSSNGQLAVSESVTSAQILAGLLDELSVSSGDTAPSEIFTDRMIAGLDVITPKAIADILETNIIRSASESGRIAVGLTKDGEFVIAGQDSKDQIKFDAFGNGTFAGTITADRIKANQIEGLEIFTDRISSLALQVFDPDGSDRRGDALQAQIASGAGVLASESSVSVKDLEGLVSEVKSLSSKVDLLTSGASISAFLSQAVNSNFADYDSLNIKDATISGRLTVLGRSLFSDVGITGNVNAGVISINGLSGQINTLSGDLYLQNEGLGGIDILNGKITIDTRGNLQILGTITADTVEAKRFTVLGESIGSAAIPAGAASIEISTQIASESSKIFLTTTSLTDKKISVVEKSNGKFKVAIPEPSASPITFDWWIVGSKD